MSTDFEKEFENEKIRQQRNQEQTARISAVTTAQVQVESAKQQEHTHLFAEDWIESWNSHDLDRILSHYADDVEFVSPFIATLLNTENGSIRGKQALSQYFSTALEKYPNLRFTLQSIYTGEQSITLCYESVNDLFAAEVMEYGADQKVKRVQAHYRRKARGENEVR